MNDFDSAMGREPGAIVGDFAPCQSLSEQLVNVPVGLVISSADSLLCERACQELLTWIRRQPASDGVAEVARVTGIEETLSRINERLAAMDLRQATDAQRPRPLLFMVMSANRTTEAIEWRTLVRSTAGLPGARLRLLLLCSPLVARSLAPLPTKQVLSWCLDGTDLNSDPHSLDERPLEAKSPASTKATDFQERVSDQEPSGTSPSGVAPVAAVIRRRPRGTSPSVVPAKTPEKPARQQPAAPADTVRRRPAGLVVNSLLLMAALLATVMITALAYPRHVIAILDQVFSRPLNSPAPQPAERLSESKQPPVIRAEAESVQTNASPAPTTEEALVQAPSMPSEQTLSPNAANLSLPPPVKDDPRLSATPLGSSGTPAAAPTPLPPQESTPTRPRAEDRTKREPPKVIPGTTAESSVRNSPASTFYVQHAALESREVAEKWRAGFPSLAKSRVVRLAPNPERGALYAVVSGPFPSRSAATRFAGLTGLPPGPWIRTQRSLSDALQVEQQKENVR